MKSFTSLLKLCEARLDTCAEVNPSHAPVGTIPAQVRLTAASPQRPIARSVVGLMMSSETAVSLPCPSEQPVRSCAPLQPEAPHVRSESDGTRLLPW